MSNLLERVKEHEGFRSKVYKCTEGFDTIDYEFAIKDLVEKLDALIKRVKDKFSWLENAPQEVEDVLVEMSYQMGVSGVSKFKNALKYMEHNNWTRAAEEMLDSKWHRQTPNRAKELSSIIRGLDE